MQDSMKNYRPEKRPQEVSQESVLRVITVSITFNSFQMLPIASSSSSSSMFLSDKERDNTWLQLPVCPLQLRPGQSCPNAADQCAYAHPPEAAMKHVLSNGYIVSCHDFVFSHSGRRGCSRVNCKYFHPPTHLRLLVINAGKNNKRLRNEMMIKQSSLAGYPGLWKQQQEALLLQHQQHQSQQALLTAFQPGGQMLQANSFLGLPAGAASSYAAAPNSASTVLVSPPQGLQKPVEPEPPGTAGSCTPNRKRSISDEGDENSEANKTKKATLESQMSFSSLMQPAVFNGGDLQRLYQPVLMQNQMVPMSFLGGGYYQSSMMPQFGGHQALALQNPALWTYIYDQSLKQ